MPLELIRVQKNDVIAVQAQSLEQHQEIRGACVVQGFVCSVGDKAERVYTEGCDFGQARSPEQLEHQEIHGACVVQVPVRSVDDEADRVCIAK